MLQAGRLEEENQGSCCSEHVSSTGKQMTSVSRELLKPSSTCTNMEGRRKIKTIKREKQCHAHAKLQSAPR